MDSAWEYTNNALNPNPSVDLTANTMDDPDEEFLAKQVTPVDMRILDLLRFLSAQDAHPDPEWFELAMMRFPWLDGVMTVDTEEKPLYQYPQASLKPLDPSPLYKGDGSWIERGVQMHIDYTELGPEMYIAKPMFSDTDWLGLLVVYFDPRVFFNFCPNPKDFIVLDPKGDIWTVEASPDRVTLAQIPWPTILRDQVRGTVHIESKSYTWLARYIGKQQIIYAVQDKDKNEEPWLGLFDDQNIYVTKEQQRTVKERNYATFAQPSGKKSTDAAKKTTVAATAAGTTTATASDEDSNFWSWLPWVDDPQKAAEEPGAPQEVVIEGAGVPPGETVETETRVLAAVEGEQQAVTSTQVVEEAPSEGGFWSWLPWVGEEPAEAGAVASASGSESVGAGAGAAAGAAGATAAVSGTTVESTGAQAQGHLPEASAEAPANAVSASATAGQGAAEAAPQSESSFWSWLPWVDHESQAKKSAAQPEVGSASKNLAVAQPASEAAAQTSEAVEPEAASAGAAGVVAGAAVVSKASAGDAPQAASTAKTSDIAALEQVRFHEFPEGKDGPGETGTVVQPKIEPEPASERGAAARAAVGNEAVKKSGDGDDGETWFSWLPWFDENPPSRGESSVHAPASKAGGSAGKTTADAKTPADAGAQETWFSWLPWFDDQPVVR